MKKKILLLLISLPVFTYNLFGQTQYSAYTAIGKGVATTFVTDYQSLGINSSVLGWKALHKGKSTTIGTSEFAFGVSSPELDKDKLQNAANSIYDRISGKNNNPIDFETQREIAGDYAEAGIAFNLDYNWFGAAYQNEKLGGIAVSVRERYNWYSKFNETTADLIFRGNVSNYFDSLTIAMNGDTTRIANNPNISNDTLAAVILATSSNPLLLSELTDGTSIKASWNREFNIGYGRKILGNDSTFAIYGGIGARFIQSVALFDFQSDDNGLRMNASMSPSFGIDYGSAQNTNPSASAGNNNTIPSISGTGYGLDFSASAVLLNKLKFAVAVNNIGSVTYSKDVYNVRDTLVGEVSLAGIGSSGVTSTADYLLTQGSFLELEGTEDYILANAANLRIGGHIALSKKLDFGFDFVTPFDRNNPGSISNPIIAFGGDFRPVKWLQLSAGYYSGGVFKNNIPLGINFILKDGSYEFGVSSRDALSFFTQDANSLSFAMGFARFRF